MKKIKDELQNISRRDGPIGGENLIKTWEENEIPSVQNSKIECLKSEEKVAYFELTIFNEI